MTERPILFSAPMVRAILEGWKTVTRRTRWLNEINEAPDAWEWLGQQFSDDGCELTGLHWFRNQGGDSGGVA